MSGTVAMRPIAYIRSDFPEKFGIPRQSMLVDGLRATVVFTPECRNPDALRGLEGYSHIWLLWVFSEAIRAEWSPTVRPPRLGGNKRCGVFATRSPFRPNPIGLSLVRIVGIRRTAEGTVIDVAGADLLDGTPILDIKPYQPRLEAVPDARGGFAAEVAGYRLKVAISRELLELVPEEKRDPLIQILSEDPRPAYQKDPERVYGMSYAGMEVKFIVDGEILVVQGIQNKF